MNDFHLNSIILRNKNIITYIIIFSVSFVSFLWLHGGILFFWDETLPIFPYYELTHFTYIWSPFGLGVINSHSNQNFSYYVLWTIFYFISFKFLPLAEQLLISFIFLISGISSFLVLKFIFNKISTKKSYNYLALIGSLFYMFNYFSAFLFYEIQPYWISYALLPLGIYIFLKGLTKLNSNINIVKYVILSSFLFEIIFSFTYFLPPVLVYMVLIFLFFYLVFRKRIIVSNITKREVYYLLSTFLTVIILNLWWVSGFINLVNTSASGSASNIALSGVRHEFLFAGYKLKFWSVVTLYPLLYPIKYNNDYSFIGHYNSVYSIFFIISVIFLIVILMPIINIKSKNTLLTKGEKIALYILLLIFISFGIQGTNPLNRLVFYSIKSIYPSLLPYLYATSYYFIEIPIIMIYIILFPEGIYEITNFNIPLKIEKSLKKYPKTLKYTSKNKKKIVAISIVFLIIGIYPYYMFTPEATMVYYDGHGTVPSVVNFPPSFYKLLNYIHKNSNGSTTLILPQSYDFYSVNFTQNDTFADDQPPSYLTGSEMLIYNTTISNQIQQFISNILPNNDHFSLFLNDINVKYIIVDTNVSNYINGYSAYTTNSTKIINYINSRSNLTLVGKFGPIFLYENKNYNGLIDSGNYYNFNASVITPVNELNLMPFMKNLTDFNSPVAKYIYKNNTLTLEAINESKYNYSMFPLNFRNKNPIDANITNYNYLIIKSGHVCDSLLMMYTKAFFINGNKGKIGNTLLSPMNISKSNVENRCYINESNKTYIFPLYQYGSAGYATPINNVKINKNGTILNYINFGLGRIKNVNITYNFNITGIYLAKYISYKYDSYKLMSNQNESYIISNKNYTNQFNPPPKISYKEISPVNYIISVYNSASNFTLLFKQNYNIGWVLSFKNGTKITNHFIADEYANAWMINKTGNFTLNLYFEPQKRISLINDISLFINASFFILLLGTVIYSRRKKLW